MRCRFAIRLAPGDSRDQLADIAVYAEDGDLVTESLESGANLPDHHFILLRLLALEMSKDGDLHRRCPVLQEVILNAEQMACPKLCLAFP
jgi:hypothetical protein